MEQASQPQRVQMSLITATDFTPEWVSEPFGAGECGSQVLRLAGTPDVSPSKSSRWRVIVNEEQLPAVGDLVPQPRTTRPASVSL